MTAGPHPKGAAKTQVQLSDWITDTGVPASQDCICSGAPYWREEGYALVCHLEHGFLDLFHSFASGDGESNQTEADLTQGLCIASEALGGLSQDTTGGRFLIYARIKETDVGHLCNSSAGEVLPWTAWVSTLLHDVLQKRRSPPSPQSPLLKRSTSTDPIHG
ncbi:hypothetical protein MHYP_G00253230 [Metynnis hypsauchen]